MKNKKAIFTGILLSTLFVLFFSGLVEYLFALLLGAKNVLLKFNGVTLTTAVTIDESRSRLINSLLLLSKPLSVILSIEIAFLILQKSVSGYLRYSVIVFLLLQMGYFIVMLFYELITWILLADKNSVWSKVITLWELEGNQKFVFLFFIVVLLFTYLQVVQKRLMNYLVE